jgi:hypothetical protein
MRRVAATGINPGKFSISKQFFMGQGRTQTLKINGHFKAATKDTNGREFLIQQRFVSFVAAYAILGRVVFGTVSDRLMSPAKICEFAK